MTEATGIVGEFLELKAGTDADVLAMQCGDFYEFFGADAELVGDVLDLKVTSKSSQGQAYPMAGVPLDDLTPYLSSLVERGYRVAVADQYETDDGHAREVVRVVTPGTFLETRDAHARYLLAVVDGRSDGFDTDGYGLAFADVTTGQFTVADAASVDDLVTECYRFDPVEIIPGPSVRVDDDLLRRLRTETDALVSLHETEAFAPKRAAHRVREHFGSEPVDALPVSDAALAAAGAVLSYVGETGTGVLASMTRLTSHQGADHVRLDGTTQRNLELIETMTGGHDGSLFATIDHTETSAGGRRLAGWLTRPRRSIDLLRDRQAAVEALASAAIARDELQAALGETADLERLASRASHGSADARDLLAVRETLAALPTVAEVVADTPALADSPLATILDRPDRQAAESLRETLANALASDPPATVTQGGLLRRGYHDELDELCEEYDAVATWFADLADREKRDHGLRHVSVDRNRTDGYYIQVGRSVADEVPDHYEEIKTLKNSKRFTTPALEERERELLRLESRRADLEYELFDSLRASVAEHAELLQDVGRTLATVDALASLATHAATNGWVKPTLHSGDAISIEAGRHPVVEQEVEFVPNDVFLGDASTDPGEAGASRPPTVDRQFLIVTGPNMSGKSTYMRQVACIVLLAQIGSFVPARSAGIGLVDGIFTRVGALDELAQGRSTFMVEMSELSNILHTATEDSLVVLDEVGRGTATYDGISIAWAATEYLHNEVGAKTLFATHYHELTSLADHLPRVANVHVAADERGEDVTFLRTVREGPTDRSYGIHVADLAGVPEPVVDRARDVLDHLREEKAIEARGGGSSEPVQAVFDLSSETLRTESTPATTDGGEHGRPGGLSTDEAHILDALRSVDVNQTSPIELLNRVQEWQTRLDD